MKADKTIIELYEIINKLRSPEGCPWDRKQTPQSLKKYFLEEVHELLEAIDHEDVPHICEELGDLLFQILFVISIYSEMKEFTTEDVIDTICRKMVRRHPHVFGDADIQSEHELLKHWDNIKSKERQGKKTSQDNFDSIPKSLPALSRAHKVSERAARQGFEWVNLQQVLDKLQEELTELQDGLRLQDKKNIYEEIGDILFTLVNVSRLNDINAEEALHEATMKFINRFKILDQSISRSKRTMTDLSTEELLQIWNTTKID